MKLWDQRPCVRDTHLFRVLFWSSDAAYSKEPEWVYIRQGWTAFERDIYHFYTSYANRSSASLLTISRGQDGERE